MGYMNMCLYDSICTYIQYIYMVVYGSQAIGTWNAHPSSHKPLNESWFHGFTG